MSVLIKGRNLPNCCYYCPISDYSEDRDELYCGLVNSNVTEYDTRRHPDCPLVDVSEESEVIINKTLQIIAMKKLMAEIESEADT